MRRLRRRPWIPKFNPKGNKILERIDKEMEEEMKNIKEYRVIKVDLKRAIEEFHSTPTYPSGQ